MDILTSPLMTDLYQLNMMQAYIDHDQLDTATFEFFSRKMPARRGFYMAAGLESVLDFLEDLSFTDKELAWLEETGRFKDNFLDYLKDFRFTGDVHAMPEGTVCFADEPILRVSAPLPEAQLVETRIINYLQYQTLIASKAARMVLAAPDKTLVDFGLRRAHSGEAGLQAARACYIAGFAGTATVMANKLWEIPIFGTMAHSYIQAHDSEVEAFENFARSRPEAVVLLVDTYDTIEGVKKVIDLVPKLAKDDITVRAVRLDSGELDELAWETRELLDAAGLEDVGIFASGGIDEDKMKRYFEEEVPIDGYGIGTSLTTSEDVPALDCAYKLTEYAGIGRRKRSSGKAIWPGRKQVFRRYDDDGRIAEDVLAVEDDEQDGEPLIHQVMRGGKRADDLPSLQETRKFAAKSLESLPEPLRRLEEGETLKATIAPGLRELAADVDDWIEKQAAE